MSILEHLATGLITPEPRIEITDPVLFNVCFAAKAKNEVRFYMNYMKLSPSDNNVYATEGHMLAIGNAIDCAELQSSKPLYIKPASRLPDGVAFADILPKRNLITGKTHKGRSFNIPIEIDPRGFPHMLDNTIDKILADMVDNNIRPVSHVGIDSKFLRKLQKAAMGMGVGLTHYRKHEHDGAHATGLYKVDLCSHHIHSDYTAVVMPMRL